MPKEYIERENLLRQMRDSKVDKPPYGNWDIAHDCCIDIAENIPTADVVEVTHCEDCNCFELMTSNNQHFCNQFGGYVTENDYCSRPSPKNRKE